MLLIKSFSIVLREFLRKPNQGLTGSEISKTHSANQKTISNVLNSLEDESILLSRYQGRNKLYELNKNNIESVKLLLSSNEMIRTGEFINNHKQNLQLYERGKHLRGIVILVDEKKLINVSETELTKILTAIKSNKNFIFIKGIEEYINKIF